MSVSLRAASRRRWAVAVGVTVAVASSDAGAQRVRLDALAPEIDLPTLSGGRVQLSKLRGRPVVVTFWNTWCKPCLTEFPELIRAHREHGPAGLYVLGVNERDQELNTKNVEKFVTSLSVPFEVALDKRGRTRRDYLIRGMPTTVFIDSAGMARRIHRGPINRDELNAAIALILPR